MLSLKIAPTLDALRRTAREFTRECFYANPDDFMRIFGNYWRFVFRFLVAGHPKLVPSSRAAFLPLQKAERALFRSLNHLTPFTSTFCQFLISDGKDVSLDQWMVFPVFCRRVGHDLEAYSNDDGWPSLFDNYVAWMQNNKIAVV